MPLKIVHLRNLAYVATPQRQCYWEFGALVRCHHRRDELLQSLDNATKERSAELQVAYDGKNICKLYTSLRDTCREVAEPMFELKKEVSAEHMHHNHQVQALLRQIQELRFSLSERFWVISRVKCHALIWLLFASRSGYAAEPLASSQILRRTLATWCVQSRLNRATKRIQVVLRKNREELHEQLRIEIIEPLRQRLGALAWRLTRRICGTKRGPKRKWGNAPFSARLTARQWAAHVARHPRDGGWFAEELQIIDDTPLDVSKIVITEEHTDMAQRLWNSFRQQILCAQNRSGVPSWEVPVVIWRAVLWPTFIPKSPKLRIGVGAEPCSSTAPLLLCWLRKLIILMVAMSRWPTSCCMSMGFDVHRKLLPVLEEQADFHGSN